MCRAIGAHGYATSVAYKLVCFTNSLQAYCLWDCTTLKLV
jgi:hypothetical protein